VPEVESVAPGMRVHPTQRGRWQVCYQNRRFWDLTWQPTLTGDVWRVWSGPQRTKLTVPRAATAAEVLAALDLT